MESPRLTWQVWSVAPNGLQSRCRRVFAYPDWQFAEKFAQALRELRHEEVRVELTAEEE